eukprot:1159122-Pelagomonas_calceolata.AAC.13
MGTGQLLKLRLAKVKAGDTHTHRIGGFLMANICGREEGPPHSGPFADPPGSRGCIKWKENSLELSKKAAGTKESPNNQHGD